MSELEESPSTEGTAEVNEIEVSAREMGWRPEEEYEGPEGNWVNADEFVARAPLYDGLSKQKKRIKRLEKVVNELSTHNRNITAAQKEARIKELEVAKAEAVIDGDANGVAQIETHIKEAENITIPETGPSQEYVDFVDDNPWYIDNPDLAAIADRRGKFIYDKNPDANLEDVFTEVAKYVKENYMKENKPSKRIPSAEGASRGTRKGSGGSREGRLTQDQSRMMKEFISLGAVKDKAEYIDQLEAAGMLGE